MTLKELQAYLAHPNTIAFRMVLRFGESRLTPDAYRLRYHPDRITFFTSLAAHPRIFERTRDGRLSSAAGAFQFTWTTWRDEVLPVLRKLYRFDGDNFSPAMQDAGCIILLSKTKNALPLILAGRFEEALTVCRGRWTSLPGAMESQRRFMLAKAKEIYTQYGGRYAPITTRATTPESPMALPVVLPILFSLIPEIIKLFSPRMQAEVSRVTGADSNTSGAFIQAIADKIAGEPVTTEARAIATVASVLDAPPDAQAQKIAQLENFTIDYLAKVEPYIERIAQIDAEVAVRTESSRETARAFDHPEGWKLRWAQTTFTQKALGAATIIVALLIAVMTVALIWLPQDARAAVYNLLGQLIVVLVTTIGLLGATFRDQNGFSFGGTSDGEARAVARSVIDADIINQRGPQ